MSKISRYQDSNVYDESYSGDTVQAIDDNQKIVFISNEDKIHIVSAEEVGRLDLIAFKYYKNPLLWWIIAERNHIEDVLAIKKDTVLFIPPNSKLYGKGGILIE
jgi:hypothetical protein